MKMTNRHLPNFYSLLIALIMLLPAIAPAHTFVVDRTDDPFPSDHCLSATEVDCSLREAIMEANQSPGPDIIQISAGVYLLSRLGRDEDAALTGDLDVLEPVLISGAGAGLTIIDGGGPNGIQDSVFHILGVAGTVIENLTIRGGGVQDGGGLRVATEATLRSSTIEYNQGNRGGACFLDAGATLLIKDSALNNNSARFGGACYSRGELNIEGSIIANNIASRHAGAIYNLSGDVEIMEGVVSGNQAG